MCDEDSWGGGSQRGWRMRSSLRRDEEGSHLLLLPTFMSSVIPPRLPRLDLSPLSQHFSFGMRFYSPALWPPPSSSSSSSPSSGPSSHVLPVCRQQNRPGPICKTHRPPAETSAQVCRCRLQLSGVGYFTSSVLSSSVSLTIASSHSATTKPTLVPFFLPGF